MPTGICTLELPVLVYHGLLPLAVRGGGLFALNSKPKVVY